jgi:hypothetical protein
VTEEVVAHKTSKEGKRGNVTLTQPTAEATGGYIKEGKRDNVTFPPAPAPTLATSDERRKDTNCDVRNTQSNETKRDDPTMFARPPRHQQNRIQHASAAKMALLSTDEDVVLCDADACERCLAFKLGCDVIAVLPVSKESLSKWRSDTRTRMLRVKCECRSNAMPK